MTDQLGEAILSLKGAWKRFGAQDILRDASLTVHEGDRIGLIGRNGAGKSTVLRILDGADVPEEGEVTRRQGLRVAMLRQRCTLPPDRTVAEVLIDATREVRARLERHAQLAAAVAHGETTPEDEAELSALQHELDVTEAWTLDATLKRVSQDLVLPPAERTAGTLSGGELRRVDLAATLLQRPDVLMLDEPTNHIDVRSVLWLETFLAKYTGTCIVVTHDRYFLERVVNRIVELDDCVLYTYPGNYDVYLERRAAREAFESRREENRINTLKRELQWLRRGPKARGTKQKARIQRFDELDGQSAPPPDPEFAFALPKPPRLGKRVVEAEELAKSLGGRVLFRDFSLILQRGMRVGLLGPNGCGKTTLLRVLMQREPPDAGTVVHGEQTQFLYVDQSHEEVAPGRTVMQYVSGGAEYMDVNDERVYIPSYLSRFLFDRSTIHMPMANLSGGERNRVDLAKKFLRGGNVLVLDEPTNDLDLYTLRVLEEAVLGFDGAALLVSHDRYFLNRVCTHVIAFEGDGNLVLVAGNFDDYQRYREEKDAEERRVERAARPAPPQRPAEPKPRRLTYKEQKELEGIEDAIAAAEAEAARLEAAIGDPGLYAKPQDAIQAALAEHEAARARVEALYERWSALEDIAAGGAG